MTMYELHDACLTYYSCGVYQFLMLMLCKTSITSGAYQKIKNSICAYIIHFLLHSKYIFAIERINKTLPHVSVHV